VRIRIVIISESLRSHPRTYWINSVSPLIV
jgi:hypothetical protein